MRIKKTLAGAALATLALTALAACGSDDDSGDGPSGDSPPEAADIRVWLNGTDTPDAAREWLKTTFEEQHPGSTLTIEQQEWDGLVERLTTALSSESETPDVVEIGNTQAPTFTSAGAFAPLTDQLADLGGDDLLQGFVDGATVDGETYAVPYYAGSKYIFYRKDLFEKAGLEVPTTMDEFVDAAVALKADNPKPANFSGFWFPGQDWRNGAAFVWDAGGDLAVESDGEWTASLSSAESVAGLERAQQLFVDASGAPKDGNEADPWTPFCAGEVGMMSTPGWVKGLIEDPETGCPDTFAKQIGVFALPGSGRRTRPGAARRLGHRGRGEVGQPGARPGRGRADAQRGLPDDPRGERPHPGPQLARAAARRRRVRPGDDRRGVQRQAHPGRAGLGERSRALASSRTCSARSPRAATRPSSRPTPTSR